MENLSWLSGWLFQWTGVTILHGTLLALITWILSRTLLRRARPAVHAGLWAVVLLKFLVPPAIPGEAGLSAWLARLSTAAILPNGDAGPPVTGWLETTAGEPAAAVSTATISSSYWGPAGLAVAAVYFGMLVVLAFRFGRRSLATHRLVRSLPKAPEPLHEEVRRLGRLIGLRRFPEVRVAEPRTIPFVMGVSSPQLIVPADLTESFSPAMSSALLLHELAHFRRGDVWLRWIQNLAGLLLFFWPPVRWACRSLERAAELACDQWAVTVSRIDPDLYAQSLLKVARSLGGARTPGHHLAFVKPTSILEERFAMLLKPKSQLSPGLNRYAVGMLGLWAIFSLAGTGVASEVPTEVQEPGTKRVHLHVAGNPDHIKVSAEALPEADLNGDGILDLSELETYQAAHPDILVLRIEPGTEGKQEIEVRVESGVLGPVWEHRLPDVEDGAKTVIFLKSPWTEENGRLILEQHPDADADQDGVLTEAEFHQYLSNRGPHAGKVRVLREVVPAEVLEHEVEAAGGKRVVRHRVHVGDPQELLKAHPEADLDGDGLLSPQELEALLPTLSGGSVHAGSPGTETFDIRIEGPEGENPPDTLYWRTEEGEPGGEKTIMIIRRSPDPAPKPAPTAPEARRESFLKDHPEADLDGDGVISQAEAEALAARIKKSTEQPAKAKEQ